MLKTWTHIVLLIMLLLTPSIVEAKTSSKTFKVSVTIPAIVGINVPFEDELVPNNDQPNSSVRQVMMEEVWRNGRLTPIKTMVVK